MKHLSSFLVLVLFSGVIGLPRPTRSPSDDHYNEDDLGVPSDDDPLPTPPIDDEATEPDSLSWDEENVYNTQASKLDDKPLCDKAPKILEHINKFRRLHNAGPVILDSKISKAATARANAVKTAGKAEYDTKSKYGQLYCIAPKDEKDVAKKCGVDFYSTIQRYDWAKGAPTANSKLFAQMVWKEAQKVGVGCAIGPLKRTYVVVYFDKPINSSNGKMKSNILGYTDVFTSAPGAKCEKDYTQYLGTCYKFVPEEKPWAEALEACAGDTAVLVNVKNTGEEICLNRTKTKKGNSWLALNDIVTEGTYVSADGSGLEYMNWKIGEPHGKGENCVEFEPESQFGTMADVKCTEKRTFFCKKPLEGDIAYSMVLNTGAKYSSEFSNPCSKATQEFHKKLKEDIKEAFKNVKSFKLVVIHSLSKIEAPKKTRRATKSAASSATTAAKIYLQFGPKETPADPAGPISEYITKNKGKLPKLAETATLESVSIFLPGQEPPILIQAIAAAAAAKAAAQTACGIPSCYGSCAPSCPSSCCSSAFSPSFGSPNCGPTSFPSPSSPYGSPYSSPYSSPYGSSFGASPCAQPPCSPAGLTPYPQTPQPQFQQPQVPKHISFPSAKQQKAATTASACGQYGQPPCSPYGQMTPPYSHPYVQQPNIAAAPCVRSATGQCLPKPLTIRVPIIKNPKIRSVCQGSGCQSPYPYQIAPAQPPPIQPFGTPYGVPYGATLGASPYAALYGSYGNPCLPPLDCNTKKGNKGKKAKKTKEVVSSWGGSYGGGPPFAFSSFGSSQYGQKPIIIPSACGPPPMTPCSPLPVAAPAPVPFGNPCIPTATTPCYGKRAVLPQRPQQSPFGLSPFGGKPCASPPCPPLMPPMMPPMSPMMQPLQAKRCAAPPCPPLMPPMLPPMPPMMPPLQANRCAAPPCPPPMPPPMPPLMPPRLPMQPPCAAPPCPPPMPPMMPPVGAALGMLPQTPFAPNPCIPSLTNPCAPTPISTKGKGNSKSTKKAPSAPPTPQFQSLFGFTSPPMSFMLPPPPLNPCAPTPFNANPCAPKPSVKKGKNAKAKSKSKAPQRPPSAVGLNPYAQATPFGNPFNPCGPPPMTNPCVPPMLPPMTQPLPPMPMPQMPMPPMPMPPMPQQMQPLSPPMPPYGLYSPPSPFGASPCNPAFSPCSPQPKPKTSPQKGKKAKKPAAPKVPQPQIFPPPYPGAPVTVAMPPISMPMSLPANQGFPFGLPPVPNPNMCPKPCLNLSTCPTYCSKRCCKRARLMRAKKSQIFKKINHQIF